MKQTFIFLFASALVLLSEPVSAQTASDFYQPLFVGSQIKLYTAGNGSGWEARTTTYSVEGTDTIAGKIFFKEVGEETSASFSQNIFEVFWLRKDSVGNVVIGAMSLNQSTNVDSATIVNGVFFSNVSLSKGYSTSEPFGNLTVNDSVVSVTDTVRWTSGVFYNCLKISESQFDSNGTAVFHEYHYYAQGVGLVKNERTIPESQAHTDELVSFGTTGVRDGVINETPRHWFLAQNYPNPFNPSTTIQFTVPNDGRATLKVYNAIGQEVATLFDGVATAGQYHEAIFDASHLSSGIYFSRLEFGGMMQAGKMLLLK